MQIPDCAISWTLAVVFLIMGHMHLQAVSPSFSTKMVTLSFFIKLQGKLAFNISAQNCKTVNHPKGYDQWLPSVFWSSNIPLSFLLLWFDSGTRIGFFIHSFHMFLLFSWPCRKFFTLMVLTDKLT